MPLPYLVSFNLLCERLAPQRGGGMLFSPHSKRLSLHMPDAQDFLFSVCEEYSCWVVGCAGTMIPVCLIVVSFTLDKLDTLPPVFSSKEKCMLHSYVCKSRQCALGLNNFFQKCLLPSSPGLQQWLAKSPQRTSDPSFYPKHTSPACVLLRHQW